MRVNEAFDMFQGRVDADPAHVRRARHRRDMFGDAFKERPDVTEVIPSGSLARGTQLDPIHDVDLIIVFRDSAHAGWGETGSSAYAALGYIQQQVRLLLGDQASAVNHVVGKTKIRNHVVKCYLDPSILVEDKDFKRFFAVEVMPALRNDGALLVPEQEEHRWQTVDPEWLIAEVRRRQQQWAYFVRMIRVIKFWMRHKKCGVKSLAAEVLALHCLPGSLSGDLSRSVALLRFFTAATPAVMEAIEDPAGHCGEIQPGLDRSRVHGLLKEAADIAAHAVAWEREGDEHQAICCWRAIFGEAFPEPPGGCNGGGGSNGGRDNPVVDGERARGNPSPDAADDGVPNESNGRGQRDDPSPRRGNDPDPDDGEGLSGGRPATPLFPAFVPGWPGPVPPDRPQG